MTTSRPEAQWLGNEATFTGTLHSRHRHPLAPRLPVATKEETAAFWYTPEARHRIPGTRRELPVALDATLPPSILQPEVLGILSDADKQIVWRLFERFAERWRTRDAVSMTVEGLSRILDAKTQELPSYYTEYALFLGVYRILEAQQGPSAAMDALLDLPAGDPGTVAGHLRTYVLAELLRLHVATGAFRSFGYMNYPGWSGGPFNDPTHLPYRSAPKSTSP